MATIDRTTESEGGSSSENLKHVLDIARAQLDREFQRAERLDAKARAQVTLAASWFTVAQAVAALSLRNGDVPTGWLLLILVTLGVGAVSLAGLAVATQRVTRLQTRHDISPETLEAMEDSAKAGEVDFAERVIETYRGILEGAQAANDRRAEALEPQSAGWKSPGMAWWAVLVAGLAEIVVALLSRALG